MTKMIKIIMPCMAVVILFFIVVISGTFLKNVLSGRVHFPDESIGKVLTMEDGQKFVIFRRLKVDCHSVDPADGAVFKVRFRFKNLKPKLNKRLSMIPAPFLIGMKGFCEKYWTVNEDNNYFQGIYQFESKESAEEYPHTFIFRLMSKRSEPGTLSYEIIPNKVLSQYIERISSASRNEF